MHGAPPHVEPHQTFHCTSFACRQTRTPPLSIDPKATHLRLPAAPFLLSSRARGGGCCRRAALLSPQRLPFSSSTLLPWHLSTRYWQLDALHAAARCRWENRLHVCDSCHFVMSPSGAKSRLLTYDDHWHRGLFLLFWETACGSHGYVVTWETLVALVISLPMIEVGFCGADGQLAAACIAFIASAWKERSRGS